MKQFYPQIEPYLTDYIDVSSGHRLYYEACGNPNGQAVLFVHGGPGGGVSPDCRRFFNPEHYHIILVDQRGCGKSTPHASIKDNNTSALIQDFEAIRQSLAIDQWMLFGGSWGSTLSLAYAQQHPERVTELILRGIFLGSMQEAHWIFEQGGASQLFPDKWKHYVACIPEDKQNNCLNTYVELLNGDDPVLAEQAAVAFTQWEFNIATLYPNPAAVEKVGDPQFALPFARLESHYLSQGCFLKDNQLLDNIDKIQSIPMTIVQGRYDIVCPPVSAYRLHQAHRQSQLIIVDDAGHSGFEPGTVSALVNATDAAIQKKQ